MADLYHNILGLMDYDSSAADAVFILLAIGIAVGIICGVVLSRIVRAIRTRIQPRSRVLQKLDKQRGRNYAEAKKAYEEALKKLEKKVGGVVIPIIHDLGHDVDFFNQDKRDNTPTQIDYDEVLKAMSLIRNAGAGTKITIVLHTRGGYARPAHMIAAALKEHNEKQGWMRGSKKADAIIPYMALSGGTLIAIATEQIYMGSVAELGPIDPITFGYQASTFAQLFDSTPQSNIRITGDLALRAIEAKRYADYALTRARKLASEKYRKAIEKLAKGDVSHSQSIPYEDTKHYGLDVSKKLPKAAFDLVDAKVQMITLESQELARERIRKDDQKESGETANDDSARVGNVVALDDTRHELPQTA